MIFCRMILHWKWTGFVRCLLNTSHDDHDTQSDTNLIQFHCTLNGKPAQLSNYGIATPTMSYVHIFSIKTFPGNLLMLHCCCYCCNFSQLFLYLSVVLPLFFSTGVRYNQTKIYERNILFSGSLVSPTIDKSPNGNPILALVSSRKNIAYSLLTEMFWLYNDLTVRLFDVAECILFGWFSSPFSSFFFWIDISLVEGRIILRISHIFAIFNLIQYLVLRLLRCVRLLRYMHVTETSDIFTVR